MTLSLLSRPRRNRQTSQIRELVQETELNASKLVSPLFLLEGQQRREAILSMPGIERLSLDHAVRECGRLMELGVRAVALFPVIPKEKKDRMGAYSLHEEGLMVRACRELKEAFPELCLVADVALDPYTDHGHDGLISTSGRVQNDETVEALCQMALLFAEAGADIIAPSDMMDGRIGAIRGELDRQGYKETLLLSYAAKYASSFYGPFRDALGSAPKFGDKKGYQMDPRNQREAVREALLDEREGADMLLVKPAGPYLDVIAKVREATVLPLGAYHVSGEYSMVMAAAKEGWLDPVRVFEEALIGCRRAGADFILTYAAGLLASHWRGVKWG